MKFLPGFTLLLFTCYQVFSKGMNVDTLTATYLNNIKDWFIKAIGLDMPNLPMFIELDF